MTSPKVGAPNDHEWALPIKYTINGPCHVLPGNHGDTRGGGSMEQSINPSMGCPVNVTMGIYHGILYGTYTMGKFLAFSAVERAMFGHST